MGKDDGSIETKSDKDEKTDTSMQSNSDSLQLLSLEDDNAKAPTNTQAIVMTSPERKPKRNWKSVASPEGSAEARLRAIGKEDYILEERARREKVIQAKELIHQMKEWTLEQSLPIAS